MVAPPSILRLKKVSDDVLAPSVSQLDKTVNSVAYDVTPYIRQGMNDLVIWLGTGWYREHTFKAVHQGPLVKAELDVLKEGEATVEIATDTSWKARASEYSDASNGWWYPHQFGGECVDGHLVLADMQTETLDNVNWNEFGVCEVYKGHWAWEQGITNSLARHHDYAWAIEDTITYGTTFKLGVARDGANFHVYVNGNYVGSYQLSADLTILCENGQPVESYVGFYQFASDVTFSNYSATTDAAAVAAKVPAEPIYTDFLED